MICNRIPILVGIRRDGDIPRICCGSWVGLIGDKNGHDRVGIHRLDGVAVRFHRIQICGRRSEKSGIKVGFVGQLPRRHLDLVGFDESRQLAGGGGRVSVSVDANNERRAQQVGAIGGVDKLRASSSRHQSHGRRIAADP